MVCIDSCGLIFGHNFRKTSLHYSRPMLGPMREGFVSLLEGKFVLFVIKTLCQNQLDITC